MRREILTAIAAMLLAGCGKGSAFQKGFDDSYVKNFKESCIKQASVNGAPTDVATSVCDCAANKAATDLTMQEKMSLPQDKMAAIMESCLKQ